MPKIRKEPYKAKIFSLSEETIRNIKEISEFEGMKESEFIEFLIKNWDTGIDPTDKLIELQKEKEKLQEKINLIEEKIKEKTSQIKIFSNWAKQKKIKKEHAMPILEKKILERDFIEAERLSKVWQRITGIPAVELLVEASENIKRKGI